MSFLFETDRDRLLLESDCLDFFLRLLLDLLLDLEGEFFRFLLFFDLLLDLIFFLIFSATGRFFLMTIFFDLAPVFFPLDFLDLDLDLEVELELEELELEELELRLKDEDEDRERLRDFLPVFLPLERDLDLLLLIFLFLAFSFLLTSLPNSSLLVSAFSFFFGVSFSTLLSFFFPFLSFFASSNLLTS